MANWISGLSDHRDLRIPIPVYIDQQIGFLDYQIIEISGFSFLCILTGKLDFWIIRLQRAQNFHTCIYLLANWISGLSDDRDLRIPLPMYIDWQIGFLDYQITEILEFPYLLIFNGKLDFWIIRSQRSKNSHTCVYRLANWISGLSDYRDLRILVPVYIDWQIGFLDYQIVEISEFPCLGILTGKLDLWIIRKYQCWTVGAIFTFARSQMFGPDKLGSLAVGCSRSQSRTSRIDLGNIF